MRPGAIVVIFFCAALQLAGAEPYAGYIYPSGIKRGTSARLIVGGQNLRNAGVLISGKGVTVKKVTAIPGMPNVSGSQRKYLVTALRRLENGKPLPLLPGEEIRREWRKNKYFDAIDTLSPLERDLAARSILQRRNPLQETPSLRQLMIVDVEVAADAEAGERSFQVFNFGGISAPRPFFIDDKPHVVRPFYTPEYRKGEEIPVIEQGSVIDGAVMPGSRDLFRLKMAGGQAYTLALKGRYMQPFIGDAVPGHFQPLLTLRSGDGVEAAYADDEFFDPDPVMRLVAPRDGEYILEVRDNLWRGREDFVYRIEFDPGLRETAFAPSPFDESSDVSGFVAAGERLYFKMRGHKGENIAADVAARRCGSPLDGRLRLFAPSGKLVADNDDRSAPFNVGRIVWESDPYLFVTLEEDGIYTLELSDRSGNGGKDHRFHLRYGPAQPAFTVYAAKSALNVVEDGVLPLRFCIERRDGFSGPVRIYSPDIDLDATIPAGEIEFTLPLVNPFFAGREPVEVEIFAEAEIADKKVRRKVIPADEYLQAFAYTHLLPAERFQFFSMAKPKPKPGKSGQNQSP